MAGNIDYFVVDASFLLSFLFPDENNSQVEKILDDVYSGKVQLMAPLLLPFEIFNGFWTAFIKGRVSENIIENLSEQFFNLNVIFMETNYLEVLKLASSKKLTFYDATYLYLSQSQDIPLLTLDKQLQKTYIDPKLLSKTRKFSQKEIKGWLKEDKL